MKDLIINSISNSSCTALHEVLAGTTNSQPLFEKRLQQNSISRSTLQGEIKFVDIKPKTVKREVSNFSLGRTFDTVRCIQDRLGGLLSKDINRRGMVSRRTGTAYKYTKLTAAKFVTLTFCKYKKDLVVSLQLENEPTLVYFAKMGGIRSVLKVQEFFLANQITLTAKYLLGTLDTKTDKASKEMKNSSSE